MRYLKVFWPFMFLIILALGAEVADAKRTTRDLVFEEDEKPAAARSKIAADKPVVVAIKTAIELDRNGQKATVLPSFKFKSGDRVRLIYTINTDGYVYWLSQGSTGKYYMLFPNPKAGTDNSVKANEVYTIPVKGRFKFDQNAGTEKILVVLAKAKIPELEKAAQEAAVKGGKVSAASTSVNKVQKSTTKKRRSRDLVFEEEEDETSGVATSSQASASDTEPMVVYYELVHE